MVCEISSMWTDSNGGTVHALFICCACVNVVYLVLHCMVGYGLFSVHVQEVCVCYPSKAKPHRGTCVMWELAICTFCQACIHVPVLMGLRLLHSSTPLYGNPCTTCGNPCTT